MRKSRKEQEDSPQLLRFQEKRWQAILDTARDAIISIDGEGTVTLFNRSAEKMFGYRAREIIGKSIAMLLPTPRFSEHESIFRDYDRPGKARVVGRIREVMAKRRNGQIFPAELSVSKSRLGKEVTYTAIVRDVSGHIFLYNLFLLNNVRLS